MIPQNLTERKNNNNNKTLKHQVKFVADNILIIFYFSEKIRLDISCEWSAGQ